MFYLYSLWRFTDSSAQEWDWNELKWIPVHISNFTLVPIVTPFWREFFFLCKHVPAITLDLSHKSVPFLHYRGYLKKKLTTEYSYYLCNRFHCQFWPKLLYYFPWYRTPRVCQVLILFAKFGWIWPYSTWWYMMHVYQCMCNKYNYVLDILKTCQNKLVTHSPLCSQYRSMSLYFSTVIFIFSSNDILLLSLPLIKT